VDQLGAGSAGGKAGWFSADSVLWERISWNKLKQAETWLVEHDLGLKDSSRDFQLNCVISYLFYLHLILHASG
jgi:hypothetical protein